MSLAKPPKPPEDRWLSVGSERLCAVSAQPVASLSDADRKLVEQILDALEDSSKLIAHLGANPKKQDRAIAALRSRLDGANAGEKP